MSTKKACRYLILPAVAITAGLSVIAPAWATAGAGSRALYVSAHGSSGNAGMSCATAKFTKITAAVRAASPGGTVVVCGGTYKEDVLISKPLTLLGRGSRIDATGLENGIQIVASDVVVRSLNVRNANGEGFLVGVDSGADAKLLRSRVLHGVRLVNVQAVNNDKGFNGTEKGNCKYPGDCGGGIHLNVVSGSVVRNSVAVGNADGILLTDDYGPAFGNRIVRNWVTDNKTECGIVLPSHSSTAVSFSKSFALGRLHPAKGGVYKNVVLDNVTLRNGTAKAPPQFGGGGSGSGIGLFGSGPGSAVYDNLVKGNVSSGNGLAGFTIHAHHPGGEYMNGNRVVGNFFGKNNLGGDGYDGPPVTDFQTTGIAVFSVPTVHMTIGANFVANDEIGVWLSKTVHAARLSTNRYFNVRHPVVRG